MNCGCTKEIGCFKYNENIDFGFTNPCPGDADFTFQIWANGSFVEIVETFGSGEAIVLPYTFNENSDTMIKIKLPSCMVSQGVNYATSVDGACCFIAHGIPGICVSNSGGGGSVQTKCLSTDFANPLSSVYNILGVVINGTPYSTELLITTPQQLTDFILSLGYECESCFITLTSIVINGTDANIGSIITSFGTFGMVNTECL